MEEMVWGENGGSHLVPKNGAGQRGGLRRLFQVGAGLVVNVVN